MFFNVKKFIYYKFFIRKTSEEFNYTQSFQKYNSFREKLKNKEYLDNKNSDDDASGLAIRKDSLAKNEIEAEKKEEKNELEKKNVNKSNLKSLFSGEWEEMQKKKEQEISKQNKKILIAVDNLPTLDNYFTSNQNEEENENINNDKESKDSLNPLENEDLNKQTNIGLSKIINPVKNTSLDNQVIVSNKKGKKTNAKKKFVNLDFTFNNNLVLENEETLIEEDLLEEDILYKNLANRKPKEMKSSAFVIKKKK